MTSDSTKHETNIFKNGNAGCEKNRRGTIATLDMDAILARNPRFVVDSHCDRKVSS